MKMIPEGVNMYPDGYTFTNLRENCELEKIVLTPTAECVVPIMASSISTLVLRGCVLQTCLEDSTNCLIPLTEQSGKPSSSLVNLKGVYQ